MSVINERLFRHSVDFEGLVRRQGSETVLYELLHLLDFFIAEPLEVLVSALRRDKNALFGGYVAHAFIDDCGLDNSTQLLDWNIM